MDELTPKDLFLESVERCLATEAFIPSFYDRFLLSSDEVRNKFRFTDFEHQNKMLARSLRELHHRAATHDRDHLNIRPELYSLWLDALIESAKTVDVEWGDKVKSAWRTILGHAIGHMSRKY